MGNARHRDQRPDDGIHVPFSYEVADEAARLALSGLTSEDLGKFVYQQDTGTLWAIASLAPLTYSAVAGTVDPHGSNHYATGVDPVDVTQLGSGSAVAGQFIETSGTGTLVLTSTVDGGDF